MYFVNIFVENDILSPLKNYFFTMRILRRLRISRGDSFVIKKNIFLWHILRRFYGTSLECTRGNDNDDGFICKNVVVFNPFRLDLTYNKTTVDTISHVLVLSHHITRFTHTNNKTLFFSISTLSLSISLNQCHFVFLQNP